MSDIFVSKDDMISLMKDNISDANKAIEVGNWISAYDSLNNAAFWAERLHHYHASH